MPTPEPDPIPTPGLEPSSMESHSPPPSPPQNPTWGAKDAGAAKELYSGDKGVGVNEVAEKVEEVRKSGEEGEVKERAEVKEGKRKRVVVVGLGMVGVAFM